MPLLDAIKAIKKLKGLQQIKSGTLDDDKIQIVKQDVDVLKDRLTVECTYKTEDGKEHTVSAIHPFDEDNEPNEIKIDGADVDQDDVDLDLDTKLFKVIMEYRLEFTQDGSPHVLVLRATAKPF